MKATPQRDIVCMGAGERCLFQVARLICQLPADFPAAVFIVLVKRSTVSVRDILQRCAALPVEDATIDELIAIGRIRIGPRDRQLRLSATRTKLADVAPERPVRPTIDALFGSAASHLGPRVIGVQLGGADGDGSEGARAIHSCGGLLVVPAPAVAVNSGIMDAAISACRPDYRVPLESIVGLLLRLTAPTSAMAHVAELT